MMQIGGFLWGTVAQVGSREKLQKSSMQLSVVVPYIFFMSELSRVLISSLPMMLMKTKDTVMMNLRRMWKGIGLTGPSSEYDSH